MARREAPEINGGSMADIAFMLLIFFLVATTMDVDSGLARMLPPKVDQEDMDKPPEVRERNVFVVQINGQNKTALKGEPIRIDELKDRAKEFIANANKEDHLPQWEVKSIPFFGDVEVRRGVISLQNDNGTSYETYIAVQNELVRAYNELREDLAQSKFHKPYDDLDAERQKAVRKVYPQKISEAEPRNIGKK